MDSNLLLAEQQYLDPDYCPWECGKEGETWEED